MDTNRNPQNTNATSRRCKRFALGMVMALTALNAGCGLQLQLQLGIPGAGGAFAGTTAAQQAVGTATTQQPPATQALDPNSLNANLAPTAPANTTGQPAVPPATKTRSDEPSPSRSPVVAPTGHAAPVARESGAANVPSP